MNKNTVKTLLLPLGRSTELEQRYQGDNAFGVLGVFPQASMLQVKRAYLKLAFEWHPDKNHSPNAREQFVKINKAYSFIMRGGDLARYLVLCDIAQFKQELAESLMIIKRAETLTGMDFEIPRPPQCRGDISDVEWDKQQRLLTGLMFRCPSCKWKEGCDIATGFSEVEEVYNRMVKRSVEIYLG